MPDLSALRQKLARLEEAQEELALGKQVVRISNPDFGSVDYNTSPASMALLENLIARTRAYIQMLEGGGGTFRQRLF